MSAAITTIFVPRDSTALALGADEVARAIEREAAARGESVRIVRNGSRGMFWLEPLVEVQTEAGRVAYGPVSSDDVAGLFDAGLLQGGEHALAHGLTDEIPFLKRQERLTFARVGITDPLSLEDYRAYEGFAGLERALSMEPAAIVQEVTDSGLRGRGGAAFPTGIKWKTVLGAKSAVKYIVCNADEGDSGTFSDRMVMEDDPFVLIEGMTIAGLAVGAEQGYIYCRSEYPHAIAVLNAPSPLRRRGAGLATTSAAAASAFTWKCARVPALCVRRGNRIARKPRRQARRGARQAAAAGARGPVRQADRHQQRDLARDGARDPRARCTALSRLRHGPFARHAAVPACRQHQAGRTRRKGVRRHAA